MSGISLSVDVLNVLYLMYLEFYSNTLLGEKITRPGENNYPAKREETNKTKERKEKRKIKVVLEDLVKEGMINKDKGKYLIK